MFEEISYGLIIKNSIKTGYFCDFFCIGAKIFIIAHHGFHHSVGQCLKYLSYEAYIYTHSPGRGPQLDPKKTRNRISPGCIKKPTSSDFFPDQEDCLKAEFCYN